MELNKILEESGAPHKIRNEFCLIITKRYPDLNDFEEDKIHECFWGYEPLGHNFNNRGGLQKVISLGPRRFLVSER